MRPLLFFVVVVCIAATSSCHLHNTRLSFSESDRYFSMSAHFSRDKMHDVERYMDRRLGDRSNMSFIDSRINGIISLEDHTTFYIRKYPGYLKIKFNKDENSYESYDRIRSMCEGIKRVVAR